MKIDLLIQCATPDVAEFMRGVVSALISSPQSPYIGFTVGFTNAIVGATLCQTYHYSGGMLNIDVRAVAPDLVSPLRSMTAEDACILGIIPTLNKVRHA